MNSFRKATAGREGLLIALGSSLTIMGSVMVAPMLPKMGQEFGPTNPNADVLLPLAVSGPALAIALFAPIAGWVSDRLGRKTMLILATLLYALFGVLPALQDDLGKIVISRLLFGCAEAAIMTCCTALIADYWQGNERLKVVNFQVVAIGLVGAIFFVIGGVLGENSWRTPFYLYLLPLFLVPFFFKFLWEPAHIKEPLENAGKQEKTAKLALLICCLMIFFGMVLNMIVTIQTPTLLVNLGEKSTTKIASAAGLGLLMSLVGALIWPLLRKRFGITGVNAVLMALVGIGLALLATATTFYQVIIAVVIHGVGAGIMVPNIMASVMSALSARVRGRGIGGFTACLYLGQFMSPILVSIVTSFSGALTASVSVFAFSSCVIAIAWLLYRLFVSKEIQRSVNQS